MPILETFSSGSSRGYVSVGGDSGWVMNTTYTFYGYTPGNQNVGFTSGLSSSALGTLYAGQPFLEWTFSVPAAGIIQFKMPSTGTYRIQCAGGRGGASTTGAAAGTVTGGGYGAVITSNISLTKDQFVNILCGSRGGDYTGGQCGGGGGGSFVSTESTFSTSTIIIAAGGGGGGGANGTGGGVLSPMHGQTGTTGGGWGGGTSGGGGTQGSGSEDGASGGGWYTNGTGSAGTTSGYGVRPNNGAGISGPYGTNFGGFGGGAAGWGAGGGGGGYSGGGAMSDSSRINSRNSAGGAGSYYTGTIQATAQNHTLNGYVTMQRIS